MTDLVEHTQLDQFELTAREQDVLQLLAVGMSNRQIAAELFLALGTVKTHIHNIYGKLNVSTRAETIALVHNLEGYESWARTAPATEDVQDDLPNPYKGLRAFQEGDAADFFGRETLVQRLLNRLTENHPLQRFLAVVGPSGSGKSSVVKAGLIPALRNGKIPDADQWLIIDMLPGTRPLDELEIALRQTSQNAPLDLYDQLQRDEYGLARVARLMSPDTDLLISIDQFEEVFTLTDDENQARHFLDLIFAASTDERANVRTIITLRADFYDRPLMLPRFSELVRQRTEVVTPLTPQELERAIVGPLEKLKIEPESGLVAAIIADVNEQPGALPLLQYALTDLFDHRVGKTITLDVYQRMGGIRGALARRADEVFVALNRHQQAIARQLFLRLITLGEGTEDTRRRVLQDELHAIGADSMQTVIDAYDESRLLTFDLDRRTNVSTVEVAHEAIIREWNRLRHWLDESRDDIRQQRLLATAASEWEKNVRDTSYLLRGSRLEQAKDWRGQTQLALTALEDSYLAGSITEHEHQQEIEAERRERELTLERRAKRRAQILVVVLSIASVFGILLTTGIFLQSREASKQRDVARNEADQRATAQVVAQNAADESLSAFLVAQAENALEDDNTDLALALILEAYRLNPEADIVREMMVRVSSVGGSRERLVGHSQFVRTFDISPDGSRAVTGSQDATAVLWDIETGTIINRLDLFQANENVNRDTAAINVVAFLNSNRLVVIGGVLPGNAYMALYDMETGERLHTYTGHISTVERIEVSDNEQHMLTSSLDRTVILWDTATNEQLLRLTTTDRDSPLLQAVFSPNGRSAVLSDDHELWLWDLETNQEVWRTSYTFGFPMAMSPDGRYMVTVSRIGTVNVYDMRDGSIVYSIVRNIIRGQDFWNFGLAINPSSTIIATTSGSQGAISLFDLETGVELQILPGHAEVVWTLQFVDDRTLWSSGGLQAVGSDHSLRVWDIESISASQHLDGIRTLSPDGQFVLHQSFFTTGNTIFRGQTETVETLEIREHATGRVVMSLNVPPNHSAGRAVFSANNEKLVVNLYDMADEAGYVAIYDLTTGNLIETGLRHNERVYSLAYAPESAFFVAGEVDARVIGGNAPYVWDLEDQQGSVRLRDVHHGNVLAVAIHPAEQLIFTGGTDSIGQWDRNTGNLIRELRGHSGDVYALSVSQDGKYLLSGAFDLILWDIETGEEVRRFSGHTGRVGANALAIHPDGLVAASGDISGHIILWDLTNGEPIHYFDGHMDEIVNLQFTPDGRELMSASLDGTTRFWNVPPYTTVEELVAWLQTNRYLHEFTCEERERFSLQPSCPENDPDYIPPTLTPAFSLTPSATFTATNTPDYSLTTATPTFTPTYTPSLTPTIPTHTPTASSTPTATATTASAGNIELGVSIRSSVRANERSEYQFEGVENQTIRISLNSMGAHLTLFDPAGQMLFTGETNIAETFSLPTTGTYTILIEPGSAAGPYTLTISEG